MLPGLVLSAIYVVYILGLGILRPEAVPPVPLAERQALARRDLWAKMLRVALPPLGLVLAVLGSIIAGIAAPTEAASMGARLDPRDVDRGRMNFKCCAPCSP